MARRVLQKNPPCVSGQCDLVFVSSFNEWHESTSLEPSIEWGDLYLNLTRDLSAVCIGETPPMQCIRGSSFEGKGIQAHDLRGVTPATAESSQKCCGRCSTTETCGGYTWIYDDQMCYLKTMGASANDFVDNTAATSAVRK
jgi:hypothetical protein